jgi:hypothetical protein
MPLDIREIDDDRLIRQANHGETVGQPFLLGLAIVGTQSRCMQDEMPAPRSERFRPGRRPAFA